MMTDKDRALAAMERIKGREKEVNDYMEWLVTTEEWREEEGRYRERLMVLFGLLIENFRITDSILGGNGDMCPFSGPVMDFLEKTLSILREGTAGDLRDTEMMILRCKTSVSGERLGMVAKRTMEGTFHPGREHARRMLGEVMAYVDHSERVMKQISEYGDRIADHIEQYLSETPVRN